SESDVAADVYERRHYSQTPSIAVGKDKVLILWQGEQMPGELQTVSLDSRAIERVKLPPGIDGGSTYVFRPDASGAVGARLDADGEALKLVVWDVVTNKPLLEKPFQPHKLKIWLTADRTGEIVAVARNAEGRFVRFDVKAGTGNQGPPTQG